MKTAVILSGCGVRDGSEIHEAVLAVLSLCEAGHEVSFFAPDKPQSAVINGVTGKACEESRNVLVESARIARGDIRALAALEQELDAFDAVVLPGGFGAATNLCDFGVRGAACEVDAGVADVLKKCRNAGKIMGFMCIAPVIAARLFGNEGVHVTVGVPSSVSAACEKMGAVHEACRYDEACIDRRLRIVSVPAYMDAGDITACYASAKALVRGMEQLVILD
ncbi:MAG: isoprenoid biosynthesis glyoxalase ElbB [Proteobacteria bacterium]|nr:isoprenoid biosynthesis glyoxalase ElbB [Pseudomonadota bacterium]